MQIFDGLSGFEIGLFWIASVSTLLLSLYYLLSIFFTDVKTNGEEQDLLSLQNNLLLISAFGWITLVCTGLNMGVIMSILLGSVGSILVVLLSASIFNYFNRMIPVYEFRIEDCVGLNGIVYLQLRGKNSGRVSVTNKGITKEFDALAKGRIYVPAGTKVSVIGLIDNSMLEVETIN